jgi:hypothetical protein
MWNTKGLVHEEDKHFLKCIPEYCQREGFVGCLFNNDEFFRSVARFVTGIADDEIMSRPLAINTLANLVTADRRLGQHSL